MKKTIIVFYVLAAFTIISSGFAYAKTGIRYVSYLCLRKPLDGFTCHLTGPTDGINPRSIVIEQSEGVVVGVVAIYPKSVSLEDIRLSLNQNLAPFEREVNRKDVYAWRNEQEGFVIGVGKDDEDRASISM